MPNNWSVSDGRLSLGQVELRNNQFVATDANGRLVGVFNTLREAAAALPEKTERERTLAHLDGDLQCRKTS